MSMPTDIDRLKNLLGQLAQPAIDARTRVIHEIRESWSDDELFGLLTILCDDAETAIVFWAARVLVSLYGIRSSKQISKLFSHPEARIRSSAAGILDETRSPWAARLLEQAALHDSEPNVRFRAVASLGTCGDVQTLPILASIQDSDVGEDYEGRSISKQAAKSYRLIQKRST